jgi:hypothetical protein
MALGTIVGSVIYLEGIKTTQAEQAVQLKNLKDNHDSLSRHVTHELTRLEEAFRRGLSELIDRFRPQPAPPSPAPSPAPEKKSQ